MPDELKPGEGVLRPGEGHLEPGPEVYVWRAGEGPSPPPSPYITPKNGIPVKRVSNYGDAFDQGLAVALAYETAGDVEGGALHDDPHDRGGVTKYGIAQRFNPEVDVRNLTLDKAVEHYRKKYWPEAAKVPASAPDLQALYFEGYMNMGRGATMALQRAIGADPDGIFGKITKARLEKELNQRGEEEVIREYLWQRKQHYRRIWQNNPSQKKFKEGWENRVDDVGYFYDDVLRGLA